jgi:menaquinone-9 beta-reductase
VRLVREVFAGDDWSPAAFGGYAAERAERMRRLRYTARIVTRLQCDSAPGALARRRAIAQRIDTVPRFALARAISAIGPELGPPESFTEETFKELVS